MNKKINLRSLTLCFALLLAAATQASAHEKWFYENEGYGLRWDLFFRPLPLAFVGAILLATLAAGLWWRKRGKGFVPGPENFDTTDKRLGALYGLIPAILGVHVAVPLLASGVQGQLFTPNNQLPAGWKYVLGLVQTGIALAIFYGALTRIAAVGLAALWFAGIFLVGFEPMLESAMYLGFAAFFFLAGRGPISIDHLMLPRLQPSAQLMSKAIPSLRAGLGLSLVVVAFTEKFANIPLASAFLERYPLNFTSALGIPLSNEDSDSLQLDGTGRAFADLRHVRGVVDLVARTRESCALAQWITRRTLGDFEGTRSRSRSRAHSLRKRRKARQRKGVRCLRGFHSIGSGERRDLYSWKNRKAEVGPDDALCRKSEKHLQIT